MNIDYDTIAQLGIQTLAYERASIERCKVVFPGAIVFDLGAGDGLWSHACLQMGAKKVIAFESDNQRCANIYNKHLTMFDKDRFQAVNAIVGPLKIDDWISQNNIKPDFIKMDIEGSELDALNGMKNILSTRPSMMIEVHGGFDGKNAVVEIIGGNPSGENYILRSIYHLYYLPEHI